MNYQATECSASSLPGLGRMQGPGANGRPDPEPQPQSQSRSEGARKIERSIHYMMEHLNQPLQVAKLAETAHTSPSHFFVLFKRWVGLSPIEFFIRLRMRRACRLLATTTMSVKEVAAVLGYDDPFYFSRVFKSVNGTPPTDYRMMLEGAGHGQGSGEMPQGGENWMMPRLPLAESLENETADGGILEQARTHSAATVLSLRCEQTV